MLVQKLIREGMLKKEEYIELLDTYTEDTINQLSEIAVQYRKRYYGNKVYTRGLIEFTNYCKNNCFYCGIRGKNRNIIRYRLTKEEILECCKSGYELGFRTFVLQGGEDIYFNDEKLCDIIKSIKQRYPDCAVTLSVGERSYESYKALKEAGADRYLLRHETAMESHYCKLHPREMSLENRKHCLYQLKELGYQVGAGFMVGSPHQTNECLAEDLIFLKELEPDMVGIGPFLPHHDTPFAKEEKGSVSKTLLLLAVVRIILPKVLLPATTALGTAEGDGREKGLAVGANVVMPNLSPLSKREQYALYDNKIHQNAEAAENIKVLERKVKELGYGLAYERGDAV
mgnify:CR=1 FL=1